MAPDSAKQRGIVGARSERAGGHLSRMRIGGLNFPVRSRSGRRGRQRSKPGPALPRCTWRIRRRGSRRTPAAPPRSPTGPGLDTGTGR
jgi:hypothetical protein